MVDKTFKIVDGLAVNGSLLVAVNGTVGVNTASPNATLHIAANDGIQVPVGNTAQRPNTNVGIFRYNSELGKFEGYASGTWIGFGVQAAPGLNVQVVFNDSTNLGASAGFTFDKTTNNVFIANALSLAIISSGNSTANLFANSTTLTIANSTSTTIHSSLGIQVGSNVVINSIMSFIGNSTVNAFMNSSTLSIQGGTANGIGVGNNNLLKLDATGNAPSVNVLSQTLTDGATVNWNMSSGVIATLTLTGNNHAIAAPSPMRIGSAILHLFQDTTAGRVVSWNSVYKWPGGVAPVLSPGANKHDIISFVCDGASLFGTYMNDVR